MDLFHFINFASLDRTHFFPLEKEQLLVVAICVMALSSGNLISSSISSRICERVRIDTDITVSAGLAIFSAELDFQQLMQVADQALYQAKAKGKDGYVLVK